MVFKLQLRYRRWPEDLARACLASALLAGAGLNAHADGSTRGEAHLRDAHAFYRNGQYFKAARYAFSAQEEDPSLSSRAYSLISLGLVRARLHHGASYFFIKTLQNGDKAAIRAVLGVAEEELVQVGGDLFRKYLIRHTTYEDYDSANLGAYLYSLAKEALLSGSSERAVGYVNGIAKTSALWPLALQLRASAHSLMGKRDLALSDFENCARKANTDDLRARCMAGRARVLYEMDKFDDADRAYDLISKASIVWPDILFEQAWNAFARGEYNRTLGKLVSYKSPALAFVFNTEVDVLRAQAYLSLCLYVDANEAINEFNAKYASVGEEVKNFVERNSSDLAAFYDAGKQALSGPLYTANGFHRMANRFVRGPYFQDLVDTEMELTAEREAVKRFDGTQPGVDHRSGRGFPGFLEQVLRWRLNTVKMLGGAFVKNSIMDHHAKLVSDFEKMAFIKLEMLKLAKETLMFKGSFASDRSRGNVEPRRRDYQYHWSFNGEFWNDELGDYVFGLESKCREKDGV